MNVPFVAITESISTHECATVEDAKTSNQRHMLTMPFVEVELPIVNVCLIESRDVYYGVSPARVVCTARVVMVDSICTRDRRRFVVDDRLSREEDVTSRSSAQLSQLKSQ